MGGPAGGLLPSVGAAEGVLPSLDAAMAAEGALPLTGSAGLLKIEPDMVSVFGFG